MLVTVKRHRLAVFINVVAGGHHVIKGRLTLTETQVHQTTGRVININQQAAFWGTAFEPAIV